ncbi:MAG: S9 family peptidase, partial [Sphingomicrobium sp.]
MRSLLGALMIGAAAIGMGAAAAQTPGDDPYIWLEEVSSPKAMDWVEQHNKLTTNVLEADPRYQGYYADALAIAQAKDRIPVGGFINGQVYNFWQDADHVRGIWRRTSVASYATPTPQWETVL